MFEKAAYGFKFVALPFVELVLDLLNNMDTIGALGVKSVLDSLIYILLNLLWEEAHLASVHQEDLNLSRVGDLIDSETFTYH